MVRTAARESDTAHATRRRSLPSRQTSADCRERSAPQPRRNADVGRRQRRRIVDAVADHRRGVPRFAQTLDRRYFFVRQQRRFNRHAQLLADALGSRRRVARRHGDRQPGAAAGVDRLGRFLSQAFIEGEHAPHPAFPTDARQRTTASLERFNRRLQFRFGSQTGLLHQSQAAQINQTGSPRHAGGQAAARQGP